MKKQNWFIELAHFVESRRDVPFIWGQNDCSLFVADAIELMTGIDPAAPYRGHYSTAQGAYRALKQYGNGSIAGALDVHFDEIEPCHMGRGDVALVDTPLGLSASLFFGNKLWVVSESGLITLPRSSAVRAWRIE